MITPEEKQDLITELKKYFALLSHTHEGTESHPVSLRDLINSVNTVSAAPADAPRDRFYEQFKIYKNGATKRLYIYDFVNKEWDYVALT